MRQMKQFFAAALAAGLFLAPWQAFAQDAQGFYIGTGYGSTVYADDDLMDDAGYWIEDDDDSGRKVYAGYQINNIVGIEASWTDYGTFRAHDGFGATYSQSFKAVHLAANVGYSFLEGQIRPFALVGLGHIDHDANEALADSEDMGLSFYFGYGFQYEPKALHGFGLRVGYDLDVFDREVLNGWYTEDYGQGLGLWYAAVQYRF